MQRVNMKIENKGDLLQLCNLMAPDSTLATLAYFQSKGVDKEKVVNGLCQAIIKLTPWNGNPSLN